MIMDDPIGGGKGGPTSQDPFQELLKTRELLGGRSSASVPRKRKSSESERIDLLLALNQKMASILSVDILIENILDEVIKFAGADRGIVLLHRDFEKRISDSIFGKKEVERTSLVVRAARSSLGQALDPEDIDYSHSVVDEVDRTVQPKFAVDAPTDPSMSSRHSVVALKLRTVMCVPLVSSGRTRVDFEKGSSGEMSPSQARRVFGVLYIDSKDISDPFTQADLDLIQALANNLVISLENAWMHKKMQSLYRSAVETTNRINRLYDVQRAISSTLILEDLLNTIMDHVIQVTGAERGFLMLKDEKGELQFKVARNLGRENLEKEKQRLSRSVVEKVARTGEPVIIENMADQAISPDNLPMSMVNLQLKTVMCVPLKIPQFQRGEVSGTTTTQLLKKSLREAQEDEAARNVIGVIYVDSRAVISTFRKEDLEMFTMFASQAAISIENARLYQLSEDQFLDTVRALAAAIDAKDPYTHGHSTRVSEFSISMGEEMGMSRESLKRLRLSALLHDVGKIGIPDAILCKPAPLNDDEFSIMKKHPELGKQMMGKVATLVDIIPGMMEHHEKVDGTGYPLRLSGDQITLEGKIISVADAFDAMTSNRPYRRGLDYAIAIKELKKKSGTQFDTECVVCFERAFEKGKIKPFSQDE